MRYQQIQCRPTPRIWERRGGILTDDDTPGGTGGGRSILTERGQIIRRDKDPAQGPARTYDAIAYYRFDEPTLLVDSGPNGLDLSTAGSCTFNAAAEINGGANLTGATGSLARNNWGPVAGDFTSRLWLNLTSGGAPDNSAHLLRIQDTPYDLFLYVQTSGLGFKIGVQTEFTLHAGGVTLAYGGWHHIVLVYTDATTTVSLYIDSVLDFSAVMDDCIDPNPLSQVKSFEIGDMNNLFHGILDEAGFWNGAWTAADVALDYGPPALSL